MEQPKTNLQRKFDILEQGCYFDTCHILLLAVLFTKQGYWGGQVLEQYRMNLEQSRITYKISNFVIG